MEMRILDLDSGVERWNVTPSKSETTWSTETWGALFMSLVLSSSGQMWGRGRPREAFGEDGLD